MAAQLRELKDDDSNLAAVGAAVRQMILEAPGRAFRAIASAYREMAGACKRCYASGVQQMVRAERAGAGVMFSIDTETGFPRSVLIFKESPWARSRGGNRAASVCRAA